MSGKRLRTAIGALCLCALGFAGGAAGSAWYARDQRAKPWRALRLEHEGSGGSATRTRVVFENEKLALASVELLRDPDGKPELGRIEPRGGAELTVRFGEKGRPASLEADDGHKALFGYDGDKVRVGFVGADGVEVAAKVVRVPVELSPPLRLAQLELDLIAEAWADEKEDPEIVVRREAQLRLDLRAVGAKEVTPGRAQIEASCAPYTCLPINADAAMPGQTVVRVAVTGTVKKSALEAPQAGALEPFRREAQDERRTAAKVMPSLGAVVAAAAVTTVACKSSKLDWSICQRALDKKAAGAAIAGISSYVVKTTGIDVEQRAIDLFFQDQARAALDKDVGISVCASRDGFARSCIELHGRPFAPGRPPLTDAAIDLRRGLGDALNGSFELFQSDGADCKFSPSPKTSGVLKLSLDSEKGVLTGTMKADDRGTRGGLRCSLGTATMRWSQSYNITVTQSFSEQQLSAGGKLPLRLTGTMSGVGSYSFSGCASSGGVSGACPAGRTEPYSHPIELNGTLDLDSQTGSGQLVVQKAPLATRGTWRVPGAKK